MKDERRPQAPIEIPTKGSTDSLAESALTSEDREAARASGYAEGMNHKFGLEIEDQVQARLHQLSLDALGMAQRHSAETGPAWSALIAWAAESK